MNHLKAAALNYVEQFNWPVFPLKPKGKEPLITGWPEYASTDPEQIQSWWSSWPDANIGLVTGPHAGFDVLDVDGELGQESLEHLVGANGALPATAIQLTGQGQHILFKHEPGVRNSAGQLGTGLDIRGEGGFIVAAPSVHPSGRTYTWELSSQPGDVELAAWPQWLLDRLPKRLQEQPSSNGNTSDVITSIPNGQRNATLTSLAGSMRWRGMSVESMQAALQIENKRCDPPLSAEELARIARSVGRYTPPSNGQTSIDPSAPKNNPLSLTDTGNAQRLVARYGQDIRYCFDWGTYMIWDGRRWLKDQTGEIVRKAKQTNKSIYAEAADSGDENQSKALAKHALRSQSKARIDAMIDLARTEPGVPVQPADLDADVWAFNVLNGTLDLKTGQYRPHSREELATKLAPVSYQPDASCPNWLTFLRQIMGDNDALVEYLQRAVGYALTGSTREQVLFMMYGTGANGKSTFLDTIRSLLGDYAQQTNFSTFMTRQQDGPRNDVARLVGARFAAAAEAEAGRRLSEVIVKQLTGGDAITARFLHKEFFEFIPQFKLFLAANHKPVIRGTDNAIWRRIRLIPFTVTIPEGKRDKDLPERLKAELPGILTWAVEGCLRWQKEGLGEPEAVKEATGEYRDEMDSLGDFFKECCVQLPTATTSTKELYEAYKAWCEGNSEEPLKKIVFARHLGERGYEPVRTTTTRSWKGIGLRASPAQEAMTPSDTKVGGVSTYTPSSSTPYRDTSFSVIQPGSVIKEKEKTLNGAVEGGDEEHWLI